MAGFKFSVSFVLQQTKDVTKLTPLRCYIRYNNTRCIIASGIMIEPRYWNTNSQEPRAKAAVVNLNEIKTEIKNVRDWIDLSFKNLTEKYNVFPDPALLKNFCENIIAGDGKMPGESPVVKYTLLKYFSKFIADSKSGVRTKKDGTRITEGTIKTYNSAKGVIERCLKHHAIIDIPFEDVDLNFYYQLKNFCYEVSNYTDNYFGVVIAKLKTVMDEAKEDKLHQSDKYKHKRFVAVAVEVDNVYLNEDQLQTIADIDLSKNTRLERVRDLFLVGCWTGLRFSDFRDIKSSNISADFFDIKTQKTKTPVAIPIHPTIRQIMTRYAEKTENSLPPPMSNVKLNAYIKEVGGEVKFDNLVSLEKHRAGHKVILNLPLKSLITTHTARRAFASNMFKMGVPSMVIMAITGHTTEKSFMKYIKVTPREKAEMMLEVWNRKAMKAV